MFHAAAHKHVPLMEGYPSEAIKNNVFGTLNTCRRAVDFGAKKFILISTDKAVNPTNIMGASKRLAEIIVQSMNRMGDTKFAAVRFGNVLGSNGSVIPLFRKQLPVVLHHFALSLWQLFRKNLSTLLWTGESMKQFTSDYCLLRLY